MQLVTPNGQPRWLAEPDDWAAVKNQRAVRNVTQPIRFQGQWHDEESGLYYNRHRYYDPQQGRYISQDPIGLNGGTNLYGYVTNPTGMVDPLGLSGVLGADFSNLTGLTSSCAQEGLTQGQVNNMSPADLLTYFGGTVIQNGDGQNLYFGPDSKMSQLFSQGKGPQAFENFLYDKFGGSLQTGDRVDDYGYAFNTPRFFGTTNTAEHVVGSWGGGTAVVVDQQVLFRATNTMGASSFFAGRYTEKILGWSVGPKASDVHMTIEWTSPVRN